ncbi:MAG: MATE family efflux transporter, partial [Moorea sp. SIO4A1]
FSQIVLIAISASIGPFVGQNWGAKKYLRVHQALRLSFLFCLFWGVLVTVILAATAPWLASLFNSNPEVITITATYLVIVPISYAGAGVILVASSTFNALGKPLPSVVMMVTRMVVLYIPLAYLGSQLFGVNGIFAAACISNVAVGLGAYIWNQKTCNIKTVLELDKNSVSAGMG